MNNYWRHDVKFIFVWKRRMFVCIVRPSGPNKHVPNRWLKDSSWSSNDSHHLSSLNKEFTQVQCKLTKGSTACTRPQSSCPLTRDSEPLLKPTAQPCYPHLDMNETRTNLFLGSSPSVEDWEYETPISTRVLSQHLTPQPGMILFLLIKGFSLDISIHLYSTCHSSFVTLPPASY